MTDYKANWRIAGSDVVPYSKDYSEWLTMLVEVLNGQKNASNVWLEFSLSGSSFSFTYTDDGDGCTFADASARLLSWASIGAVNGDSIYGHGTKKFLAKSGDYEMPFVIRSRPKGAKSKAVLEWTGPYKGLKTKYETVDEVPDFPSHGFQIVLNVVDRTKLGKHSEASSLQKVIQEIIRARKSQGVLNTIQYTVTVREVDDEGSMMYDKTETSKDWTSFFQYLRSNDAVQKNTVKMVEIVPGKVTLEFHSMRVPQHTHDKEFHAKLMNIFPTYGDFSGGNAARVHCFNEGTMIEACPFTEVYGRATHSSMYHTVEFAFFSTMCGGDAHKYLPQPGTTKVQYRYETPIWKEFIRLAMEFRKTKTLPQPLPQPLPEPQPQPQPEPRPDPPPVPWPQAGMFAVQILNDRKKTLEENGATVAKYLPPAWIQFSEILVATLHDKVSLETFKERQKGDLTDDVHKAYTVLSYYANQYGIAAENLKFTLKFKLKNKTESKKRIVEFNDILKEMNPVVYPYCECLRFTLLDDTEA
jgi:hypothetical protein